MGKIWAHIYLLASIGLRTHMIAHSLRIDQFHSDFGTFFIFVIR
jgi:hypothetical protein